ncbi:UDP-N-acetylglucosamine 1-carboxyvinyltransferase [bacterium (Candidatus Torokbacteria) CG09_land_8_20_14_0_10_42_11]|nr:MAG: UDP-N-acetylglucosamine 1-carboxyvinyltransferase [bacterium (Candidatus Torokbacteria) CG09_land_8_20_14_0_10_42_11]
MSKFVICGNKKLKGEVEVQGAKNAATPILAASVLLSGKTVLENTPNILDVERMKTILRKIGAAVASDTEKHTVKLNSAGVKSWNLNFPEAVKIRSSLLLLGPLLARFGKVKIPYPGGCRIGARSLDTHLDGLRALGAAVKYADNHYFLTADKLQGAEIVLDEFSVTATENIMMAACFARGRTIVKLAACEPHVQDLARFLNQAGAKIAGAGTHTLIIDGIKKLNGARYKIIPDMIEAGTLIIAGLATGGSVKVKNMNPADLDIFLKKLKEMGARLAIGKNYVQTFPSPPLSGIKIQTLPYPGFPTDLQAPFSVLMTQARGESAIHDPMYEGRLKYLEELAKMGASVKILNSHQAKITGPAKLAGKEITSLDLRAGATLILAGLIASGKSIIHRAEEIDRGYERIEEKLAALGADIRRF